MELVPGRLTAAAFAPFGRVLDGGNCPTSSVNEGRAVRRDLAGFPAADGRIVLARYDVEASTLPLTVGVLERHPLSEQAFIGLGGANALVVVAGSASDGSPDLATARAFIAGPETPFIYAAGTWHAPLFALGRAGRFMMTMRETGTSVDCETVALASPLIVAQSS